MPRRVNLPGADELFGAPDQRGEGAPDTGREGRASRSRQAMPSGRVRHDEKITVYFSTAELMALEHARLALRADYGINIDRGRLVREAVAMLVADLADRQHESAIVRRLER